MTSIRASYTAAGTIPAKMLRIPGLVDDIAHSKRIRPVHPQFIPTNRCNLSCGFCSCSEEDRHIEMSIGSAVKAIRSLRELGAKAATITGGGEPLMHPDIWAIVDEFFRMGIDVGLVTNGILLGRSGGREAISLDRVSWCRVSHGDFRSLSGEYAARLDAVVRRATSVDWAFSYVVGESPNVPEAVRVVRFAIEHDFTHVRFVPDLLRADFVPMGLFEERVRDSGVSLDRVVFQQRASPGPGGDCWIGYLKPVISADGGVYACCGAQYALDPIPKRFPELLRLGTIEDLLAIFDASAVPLNGTACVRCHYHEYNQILGALVSEAPDHLEFL